MVVGSSDGVSVAGSGSCLKGEGLRGRGMPWARRIVVDGRETGRWRRFGWSWSSRMVRRADAGAGDASLARLGIDVKARLDAMVVALDVYGACA